MKMHRNKQAEGNLLLPGRVGSADVAVLACDLLMLVICLWNQLYYRMNMMFLIVPLFLIGAYIVFYEILPEAYCFAETSLEIRHPIKRKVCIGYDAVFNLEASCRHSFINAMQSDKVKVYYIEGKRKRVTVCRPRNVEAFVDTLKDKCPEFAVDGSRRSRLDVFFEE